MNQDLRYLSSCEILFPVWLQYNIHMCPYAIIIIAAGVIRLIAAIAASPRIAINYNTLFLPRIPTI